MRVGIIGAGAVGAYFIWAMEQVDGLEVVLLADANRGEKLEKGITINGKLYQPEIELAESNNETAFDLILVATKYSGLESAIEILRRKSSDSTVILSLLNGVDSEEKIKAAGIPGTVLYSVMRIASKREESNIVFKPEMTQGVFLGATCEAEMTAVSMVEKCFADTRVVYTVVGDIKTDLWMKYASNIANNLPQAVLGTDASLYTDSEHGLFLATELWNEVRQVAHSQGIELPKEPLIFTVVPKTSKYSTLQDLEAGRLTEIDMFAGHVMRLAKEQHIEVPYVTYTYHAIKALEQKNDGVIGS